ncbi:putative 2-phosphosulfolactate phosphatase [Desulfarculales bacterium]
MAVLLDIFRTSNTALALLVAGVAEVCLLAELELPRALKKSQPGLLLWGKRGGFMPPDFDGDNSLCRIARGWLAGRRVILTISAGIQAVACLA